ncbi:MAG: hypothetical protein IPO63_04400 [Bacteroidetes bacterium]|nr:hypothetical protein [Bacteroidota bacterium]
MKNLYFIPISTKSIYLKLVACSMILIFLTNGLEAQTAIDSLRLATNAMKIPTSSILGIWKPVDTSLKKLEFVKHGPYVMIKVDSQPAGYTFTVENDSVYVNGVMANWPPYDCILILKDETTLEINYFQYFDKVPNIVKYKKE